MNAEVKNLNIIDSKNRELNKFAQHITSVEKPTLFKVTLRSNNLLHLNIYPEVRIHSLWKELQNIQKILYLKCQQYKASWQLIQTV